MNYHKIRKTPPQTFPMSKTCSEDNEDLYEEPPLYRHNLD